MGLGPVYRFAPTPVPRAGYWLGRSELLRRPRLVAAARGWTWQALPGGERWCGAARDLNPLAGGARVPWRGLPGIAASGLLAADQACAHLSLADCFAWVPARRPTDPRHLRTPRCFQAESISDQHRLRLPVGSDPRKSGDGRTRAHSGPEITGRGLQSPRAACLC